MSNPHSTDKGFDRISKGSELCMSCGLCCEGTLLFIRVALETEEAKSLSQLGQIPYQKKGNHDFLLCSPCPNFNDSKCSFYAQRPRICRGYRCKLLKGYLQGTISFGESIELVRKAKCLMEVIYQRIGGGDDPSKSIWKQIKNFMELQARSVNSEESRRLIARLLLDVKKLSIICSNHFDDTYFR